MLGRLLATKRARYIAVGVGLGLLLGVISFAGTRQARHQQPMIFPDTSVYFQIAQQPTRLSHLFYPKPFFVPFVYRMLDRDPARIETVQCGASIVAWWVFG